MGLLRRDDDTTLAGRIAAGIRDVGAMTGLSDRPLRPEQVGRLLSRAGVIEVPGAVGDGLETNLLLVLRGAARSSLTIYDPTGAEIGAASRFDHRYSKTGYRHQYELTDTDVRCLVRDITRRRFGIASVTYRFLVLERDGTKLATITQTGIRSDSYVVAYNDRPIARLRSVSAREVRTAARPPASTLIDKGQQLAARVNNKVWCLDDQPGHSVARITYLPGTQRTYILQLNPGLDRPLRLTALAVCLVIHHRVLGSGGASAGG